mmetsp:Transcript_48048/g.134150  ORF Transcript_48048/g.134150 Transcript_48048/m.134150 type:complete len:232 (-) Transcript_48048:59-754(-)
MMVERPDASAGSAAPNPCNACAEAPAAGRQQHSYWHKAAARRWPPRKDPTASCWAACGEARRPPNCRGGKRPSRTEARLCNSAHRRASAPRVRQSRLRRRRMHTTRRRPGRPTLERPQPTKQGPAAASEGTAGVAPAHRAAHRGVGPEASAKVAASATVAPPRQRDRRSEAPPRNAPWAGRTLLHVQHCRRPALQPQQPGTSDMAGGARDGAALDRARAGIRDRGIAPPGA